MIDFDVWWNSAAADEFRATHEDMEGSEVRPIWAAAVLATLAHTKAAIAIAEAVEQQAEPGADERAACDAAYERWTASPDFRQYNKPGFDAGYRAAQSGQRAGVAEALDLIDRKALAGLCQMTHEGARAFLNEIREIAKGAAAPTQQPSTDQS